jgi:molybdopterin converting factor small subunit
MVTVRYWAAAKQAAGVAEETLPASTLAEALATAAARRGGEEFEAVLARSSFLVNGVQAARHGHAAVALDDGTVIEVLPPFAGG